MRRRYVWEGGRFVDKQTGRPMERPYAGQIGCPQIIRPFEGYRSVVTGEYIDDRAKRREELAKARDKGLVPFERIDGRPPGLINEEFCRRGGRRTSEEAKEWAANQRAKRPKLGRNGEVISE